MCDNHNTYILYGAAAIGNIAKAALERCGIKITGYIDKRASEILSYNDLPVWSIENVPAKYINSSTVVYISVKNVFEHEKIAIALYKAGFRYIIYKPYNVLLECGTETEKLISKIYDQMFMGNYNAETKLPICQVEEEREAVDFGLICEDNGSVTAYIPAEFIFTNNYQNSGMTKWGNICILAFFTHINFFRFLNGDCTADPNEYLEEYCVFTARLQKKIEVTDAWKSNVLNNRVHIYEQMKDMLDLEPLFFIRNAAEAKWNDQRGYFNLLSGKHRTTFQVAMGKKYIPIKMDRGDYEKYINSAEIDSTLHLVYRNNIDLTISHPFFYKEILVRDKGEYIFFSWFARFYGRKLYYKNGKICFEELKILDFTNDFGNFARFCTRMGCTVRRFQSPEVLERQLNVLFNVSRIEYICDVADRSGNIVVVEQDRLDEAASYITKYGNSWIVKNAKRSKIEQFALKNQLHIVEKISSSFWEEGMVQSWLLEE